MVLFKSFQAYITLFLQPSKIRLKVISALPQGRFAKQSRYERRHIAHVEGITHRHLGELHILRRCEVASVVATPRIVRGHSPCDPQRNPPRAFRSRGCRTPKGRIRQTRRTATVQSYALKFPPTHIALCRANLTRTLSYNPTPTIYRCKNRRMTTQKRSLSMTYYIPTAKSYAGISLKRSSATSSFCTQSEWAFFLTPLAVTIVRRIVSVVPVSR